jgi:hypothetical protein
MNIHRWQKRSEEIVHDWQPEWVEQEYRVVSIESLKAALRAARPAYIDITSSRSIWVGPDEDPPVFDPDEYDELAEDIFRALKEE